MGMESFYINLTLCNNCSYDLSGLTVIFSDIIGNQRNITVSYSILSFFDGVSRIYAFIDKYKNNILKIESQNEDLQPSADHFLSFFEKVYRLWEEKINNFRLQYGYFLINPNDDFFKSYKKLRKHMKKEMEC